MLTKWHDEMITGNEDIDRQHTDLLRKVDDLLQAAKAQRGEEEIARLLWFLKRYVRKHFRDEEQLQISSRFPGYQAHKFEHDQFFRDVKRLEGRYAAEGSSTLLIVNAVHMMCDWLNNHYYKKDKALIDFLRQSQSN